MSAVAIGVAALAFMAAMAKMPTMKHAHRGVVRMRAAWLLAREMWDGAMLRRSRWDECLEKAARDV